MFNFLKYVFTRALVGTIALAIILTIIGVLIKWPAILGGIVVFVLVVILGAIILDKDED